MTRKNILDLAAEKVVLLDGGMGTSLMRRGLGPGQPGETWNLDRPEDVCEVHAAFVEAGSDVVQTNTFGGTTFRLDHFKLADKAHEINKTAAAIARKAAGEDRLVAGNIGPSGLFLPPVGTADPKELKAAFAAQARSLAEGGVDYISVETMMDLKEAMLALLGAKEGAPGLPVSVCMVFEKKKRGFFTAMGDKPVDSALLLQEEGADMVGANCSMGSKEMMEIVEEVKAAVSIPVIMKPNAGLPETKDGKLVYNQTPEDFAKDIKTMIDRGARLVGGCCGTDERFIAACAQVR